MVSVVKTALRAQEDTFGLRRSVVGLPVGGIRCGFGGFQSGDGVT